MKKICLDAGHGGHDTGGSAGKLLEKSINLQMVHYMKSIMNERYECEVIMTRDSDQYVSLNKRTSIANEAKADLFYSIHCNAFNGQARGYEDYVYVNINDDQNKTENKRRIIHRNINKLLDVYDIPDRGMKKADFYVLRNTNMSAILSENLFVDHKQDQKLLRNDEFLEKLSHAHVMGIAEALGLKKKKSSKEGLWRVQAGAFKNKSNALKVAERLRDHGFDPYIYKG